MSLNDQQTDSSATDLNSAPLLAVLDGDQPVRHVPCPSLAIVFVPVLLLCSCGFTISDAIRRQHRHHLLPDAQIERTRHPGITRSMGFCMVYDIHCVAGNMLTGPLVIYSSPGRPNHEHWNAL